ncbi:hypothetical protein LQ327_18840 [Actinomycetospora endophytica]|uniref:Uncharacterized protein n=1 Tax=Actinomycetospora endophytica TaxID=2291215 RepID=A0ABS8PDE5_9PSEU|nr:hypothetical protein [Actinomycetospora endophytica]MCD2195431.1 hypothetical protein [Actinomycetospora endophytica]
MTVPARDGAADTTAAGVPDVPDAVLGWRTWRVGRRAQRRTELIAPLAGTPWPAARPLIASCGSRSHTPPGDTCPCGLYAVADPAVLEWGPSDHEVLGVVALWGQVVEGTRGWRASRGYPRLLVTGPGIAAEQRAALARRYGVAVHRSDVPPRALAALLGADRALADTLRLGRDVEAEALLAAHMPAWVGRWEARRLGQDAARPPRLASLGRVWRRR